MALDMDGLKEALGVFDRPSPQLEPMPAFVTVDPVRNHISLAENPFGQADAGYADLGAELWSFQFAPAVLDRVGARKMAAGLLAWADREDVRP